MKTRFSFAALIAVSLLSACGGGGSGSGSSTGAASPISGVDQRTLEANLGITDSAPKAVEGASTFEGKVDGEVNVVYGDGARISGRVGGLTTPVIMSGSSVNTRVMNGEAIRAERDGDVFYLPATGSDLQVGMVRRTTQDQGVVGIFGTKTSAADMNARRSAGGTATYAGVAEVMIDNERTRTVDGYRGSISATANFTDSNLTYATNRMTNTTQTGGTANLQGSATFGSGGRIVGTNTVRHDKGDDIIGSTTGSFYGNGARNIGLIFDGQNMAGGAILDQN